MASSSTCTASNDKSAFARTHSMRKNWWHIERGGDSFIFLTNFLSESSLLEFVEPMCATLNLNEEVPNPFLDTSPKPSCLTASPRCCVPSCRRACAEGGGHEHALCSSLDTPPGDALPAAPPSSERCAARGCDQSASEAAGRASPQVFPPNTAATLRHPTAPRPGAAVQRWVTGLTRRLRPPAGALPRPAAFSARRGRCQRSNSSRALERPASQGRRPNSSSRQEGEGRYAEAARAPPQAPPREARFAHRQLPHQSPRLGEQPLLLLHIWGSAVRFSGQKRLKVEAQRQ